MPQVFFIGDEEQCLVKRLQEGDKTAARKFYSLYADVLAGICARYIADEEDVKDVFQNALVHIFSHISDFKYRGVGSLEAWAAKVVVNESLKFLRKQERHKMLPIDDDVFDEMAEEFPSITDISPETFRQMLNRLPAGYRTVLNLYVFEGKSHQEIASLLGIRKESSASQLHRAKNMLIKIIKKYNDDNLQRL
jgi:RNA polymerase sigma-70 factor (ECF subfamily)